MQSTTTEIRSLLATYERTITANEKAGVTSRMFLNNIAKQPSSCNMKARSRAVSCKNPRTVESSSSGASSPNAAVGPLLNSAGQLSRFQLTRSSSARCVRPSSKHCATDGASTSALEHQLRKHGSSWPSRRPGQSDATISTAGSSFVEDADADDAIRLFLNESLDLDDGSDDDDKPSDFSPFKQMNSSASSSTLPQSLPTRLDADSTNVPLSLRSFHRSSSSRSIRSDEDDDSTGFKLLTHREIGDVREGATTAAENVSASKVKTLRRQIEEKAAVRDPTIVRQHSLRSVKSARSDGADDELGIASNHSVRDSSRKPSERSKSTPSSKDRTATSSSTRGTRSSKSSSVRRSESVEGGSSDDAADLDKSSCHSVTVRTARRRSKPTSSVPSSEESGCDNLPRTKRPSSSTGKSMSTSSKSVRKESKTAESTEEAETTSRPKSKPSRRQESRPMGCTSPTSPKDDDAPTRETKGKTSDDKRRVQTAKERSDAVGGTNHRPSRTAPRSAATNSKFDASFTSITSSSHNGSWTLTIDDTDIDLSPGTLALSSKKVEGNAAPKSPPMPSNTERPRKSTGRVKTSSSRLSSSRSGSTTSEPSKTRSTGGSKSKGATAAGSTRSRKLVKVIPVPSQPPTPPTEPPKPSSLERRRQRHLERTNLHASD